LSLGRMTGASFGRGGRDKGKSYSGVALRKKNRRAHRGFLKCDGEIEQKGGSSGQCLVNLGREGNYPKLGTSIWVFQAARELRWRDSARGNYPRKIVTMGGRGGEK